MAANTYSRWAFLHNDWPVPGEPHPPQNLDALIAKLTYWLGKTGCDHGSGLRFITRSHDSLDEVETFGECLVHLQDQRARIATLESENASLRKSAEQELRTAQAVASGIAAAIRALKSAERQP